MPGKLMHMLPLMIILIAMKEGQVVLSDDDDNSLPECPYPCLPPPIAGTVNYAPPPQPARPVVVVPPPTRPTPPSSSVYYNSPPPPPSGFYYFSPPDEVATYYPPPSFQYSNAPPPPNPILPYFPFYYKYPPPPPGVSLADGLKRFTGAMSSALVCLVYLSM